MIVVIAAIVFAITQLGGDDNPSTKATTQTGNQIAPARTTEPVNTASDSSRAKTTVAVLNGTTVPGLARSVADKLEARKYRIGTVTNAPDQQRSATQVAYQPGSVRMARDVARIIDVGSDAVVPIDEVTSATAGPDALVVVTVGSDQSR
ncbi:MAG: LytR C-terminal domain-containing protein [Solirubrobacterales bacterium]